MYEKNFSDLETLWSSNAPIDLVRFYGKLKTRKDLIDFALRRPRPKFKTRVFRTDSKKNVVAVVLTSDLEGAFAKQILEIFNPIPTILVGGGKEFFNIAAGFNFGIQVAFEMNPTWIIRANDDMIGVNDSSRLISELERHDYADCVLAKPSRIGNPYYHSHSCFIVPYYHALETAFDLARSVIQETPPLSFLVPLLCKKYDANFRIASSLLNDSSALAPHRGAESMGRWVRDYFINMSDSVGPFTNFGDFGVFKQEILRKWTFDETYINGMEDIDYSFLLWRMKKNVKMVDYEIGSIGGGTLSKDRGKLTARRLRDVLNLVYFCEKYGL